MKHKKLIVIGGILVGLIVVVGVGVPLVYEFFQAARKQQLETELERLPIPQGCQEVQRTYQQGTIAQKRAWYVRYTCQTSGHDAHTSLVEGLKVDGYQVVNDASVPGRPEAHFPAYDFQYRNPTFVVNYRFYPITQLAEGDFEGLKRIQAEQITLELIYK